MMVQDSFLNRQIDEYKIEALLGKGGMARVYRGIDVRLRRPVAVKVIDPPFRNDANYIGRFEREAQVFAQLAHPNVVQLYRYGEKDGFLYMVMQFIDGSDLYSILRSFRADKTFMEAEDALHIIRDVCRALDYVHDKGVIHRDVKPSNILLDKDGQAYLSDFGLALNTRVGTLGETFGSAQYMAPEQAISSANAEPRSDLYSVGVILFEIFTGRLPFQAEDPLKLALCHIKDPVPPPRSLRAEIPPEIEAVILKSLAKAPSERYPNGAALVAALEAALRTGAMREEIPSTISHLTMPMRVQLQADSRQPVTPSEPLVEVPELPTATQEAPPPPLPHNEPARPQIVAAPKKPRSLLPVFAGIGVLGIIFTSLLCITGVLASARLIGRLTTRQAAVGSPAAPAVGTQASAGQYNLHLIKSGDNSLILMNEGVNDFSLASLQLGNTPSRVYGEDWGVVTLKPGECVSVWKNSSQAKLPKGVACTMVGTALERTGPQRFWTSTFNIYYQNKFAGECPEGQQECKLQFPAGQQAP